MRKLATFENRFSGRRVLIGLVLVILLPGSVLRPAALAQAPAPDAYEPDDPNPPWIGLGEAQERSFYPEGDVDWARLRVKAGHWYEVRTQDLAPLVDTVLTVELGGTPYEDDDGGAEPLASRVTFQAPETADALITVVTGQAVYSTTQTYRLYAAELPAPTPTPTWTPTPTETPSPTPTATPTSTPRPTEPPRPTDVPPRPIVSFSATPDRVEAPGQCVTLSWSVERASEVYLVEPNGNRQGVTGREERQVCPVETSTYRLEVHAPGGDETVEVQVAVPLPTHTPTPKPAPSSSDGGGSAAAGKGTVHSVVFVDENGSGAYDPQEGVLGAVATLMSQADPGRSWTATTDAQGQVRFEGVPAGSYTLLIPHLSHAEAVSVRGDDLTVAVLVPPLQLPARIP